MKYTQATNTLVRLKHQLVLKCGINCELIRLLIESNRYPDLKAS